MQTAGFVIMVVSLAGLIVIVPPQRGSLWDLLARAFRALRARRSPKEQRRRERERARQGATRNGEGRIP